MYVDESTARDYLMMCAVIANEHVARTRRVMRSLLKPGQKKCLHMKDEKRRAREILGAIVSVEPTVVIFKCRREVPDLEARERSVQRLSFEACEADLSRVVLDPIESLVRRDLSWIYAGARAAGHAEPPFEFGHQQRHEEPLMWIADAAGWAWQRGGVLRKQITPVVREIAL